MTDKVKITAQDVVRLLNEALVADQDAITNLVNARVACNEALGGHPTIQVGRFPVGGSWPEPGSPNINTVGTERRVGILGILNGLFGVKEDGSGYIAALYDMSSGKITKFEVF
jgi:hypothetical protein